MKSITKSGQQAAKAIREEMVLISSNVASIYSRTYWNLRTFRVPKRLEKYYKIEIAPEFNMKGGL